MELDPRWGVKLRSTSVHVAERSALKDGLRGALRFNHLRIQVEGDSALVINCFKGRSHVPWRRKSLVREIATDAESFSCIFIDHVIEEANFLANALAHEHSLATPKIWVNAIPNSCPSAFNLDKLSLGHYRGNYLSFLLFGYSKKKDLG
ncbi:hypothetical protein ACLB2K_035503 [Fragaria x ananassa]